jgi:ATP-binding cassette subfamily F protein uup
MYVTDTGKAQNLAQRHDEIEVALLEALERWETLELLQGKSTA